MTRRNSWMPGAAWLLVVLLAGLCLLPVSAGAEYGYDPVRIEKTGDRPAVPADTGRLHVGKTCYAPEEEILVGYSGVTEDMVNSHAWICVSNLGDPASGYRSGWQSPSAGSGTVTLKAPYEDGTYEIRFYAGSSASDENLERGSVITFTVERPELTKNISLSVGKTIFAPEEKIDVGYDGMTDWLVSHSAWICVAERGAAAGGYRSGWQKPETGSGTVTLTAPYEEGEYEIRFFDSNAASEENFVRRLTIPFTVLHSELAKDVTMETEKTLFAPEEKIVVSYSGITEWLANHSAWVCVAEKGAASNSYRSGWQKPETGSGTVTLTAPYEEGEYELRFFDNSSANDENFVRRLTIPFTVLHSELTKNVTMSIDKTLFAPEERIVVRTTGITEWLANHNAWICIAEKGAAANGYRSGWQKPETGSGTVVLTAPFEEGEYEIRFFDNSAANDENYASRLTIPFTVLHSELTKDVTMSIDKTLFGPWEKIDVHYTGVTEWLKNHNAWICIAEKGAAAGYYRSGWQKPETGNSVVVLEAPGEDGEYEIRFFDGAYANDENLASRLTLSFRVNHSELAKDVTISVDRTSFGQREMIAVHYSGITDTLVKRYAWICVADRDAPVGSYWGGHQQPRVGSGTLELLSPSIDGDYEIRFFDGSDASEDNFVRRLTIPITVGNPEATETTEATKEPSDGPVQTETTAPAATPAPEAAPQTVTEDTTETTEVTTETTEITSETTEAEPTATPEPEEEQGKKKKHGFRDVPREDILRTSGAMNAGPLTMDTVSVSFGGNETGEAALLNNTFGVTGPDGSEEGVYDLLLTEVPSEPIVVTFDRAEPGEEEEYLIQMGVPVRDRDGNQGIEWIPLPTEWSGGKARAELTPQGIDEYLADLSYSGAGDTVAGLANDTEEFLKFMGPHMIADTEIMISKASALVYIACTNNRRFYTMHFRIHVEAADMDPLEADPAKIWKSDVRRYGQHMEEIYSYFNALYDTSPRTATFLDVYFAHPWEWPTKYIASFCMPHFSIGGRFGTDPINDAFMKINCRFLAHGYLRTATAPYDEYTIRLCGAFGHEYFHLVQRCYVDKGGSQIWFDESNAAYYDSVITEKYLTLILEENYSSQWPVQFSVLTNNPYPIREYGRMPVFNYLMKHSSDFLIKVYEYLRDTGGYNSWETVLESVTKRKMAEITRDYFNELVTEGSLPYVEKGTFEPWEIYHNLKFFKQVNLERTDEWAKQWRLVEDVEQKCGPGETAKVECSISPWSATFVRLDLSRVPAKYTSFGLTLTTPGVSATLFDISGNGYINSFSTQIEPLGSLAEVPVTGHRYLVMLVNETGSTVSGTQMEISFRTESFKPVAADSVSGLSMTYSGTVAYFYSHDYRVEDATVKVSVDADGRAKVVLSSEKISRTYEGAYDPSTGTIGEHVFIRPFEGFGMEANGNPRLYEGGVHLTIHDAYLWKGLRNGPEVSELMVFNSEYKSDYPELDLTVTWNNQ